MLPIKQLDGIIAERISSIRFPLKPEGLYRPLEYMMSIGGKRIRPRLCLVSYNLFSDNIDENILGPAMAIEIFHNFTLLHDDIMDRSDTRRGKSTVHLKWDENTAILSGDVMSIMAYRYLTMYRGENLSRVLQLFTETAAKVCEGQQYDMEYESEPEIDMDDYMLMIGLKTAVLIACPAKMGALIAGASESQAEAIYRFAWQIGLAFQISDDYLDTFGNYETFGKKIGGDISNNKKTWLLVESMRCAEGKDRRELGRILAMGEDCKEEKIALMQDLYERLGVKQRAIETIEQHHRLAMECLQGSDLSEGQIDRLGEFSRLLVHRED